MEHVKLALTHILAPTRTLLCDEGWKSLATLSTNAGQWPCLDYFQIRSAQAIPASPEVGGRKEGTWHPRGVQVPGTTEDDRN